MTEPAAKMSEFLKIEFPVCLNSTEAPSMSLNLHSEALIVKIWVGAAILLNSDAILFSVYLAVPEAEDLDLIKYQASVACEINDAKDSEKTERIVITIIISISVNPRLLFIGQKPSRYSE